MNAPGAVVRDGETESRPGLGDLGNCTIALDVREQEVVEPDLSTEKPGHVHLVRIQGAVQNLRDAEHRLRGVPNAAARARQRNTQRNTQTATDAALPLALRLKCTSLQVIRFDSNGHGDPVRSEQTRIRFPTDARTPLRPKPAQLDAGHSPSRTRSRPATGHGVAGTAMREIECRAKTATHRASFDSERPSNRLVQLLDVGEVADLLRWRPVRELAVERVTARRGGGQTNHGGAPVRNRALSFHDRTKISGRTAHNNTHPPRESSSARDQYEHDTHG